MSSPNSVLAHANHDRVNFAASSLSNDSCMNPVPAVLVAKGFEATQLRASGALSDVAPTLLKLLGLEQPAEMDGVSLF